MVCITHRCRQTSLWTRRSSCSSSCRRYSVRRSSVRWSASPRWITRHCSRDLYRLTNRVGFEWDFSGWAVPNPPLRERWFVQQAVLCVCKQIVALKESSDGVLCPVVGRTAACSRESLTSCKSQEKTNKLTYWRFYLNAFSTHGWNAFEVTLSTGSTCVTLELHTFTEQCSVRIRTLDPLLNSQLYKVKRANL